MPNAKRHIPEGHRTVTPHLVVKNGLEAIAYYQKAFGAELRAHAPGATPESTMHAELRIGDSAVFLTDMVGGPSQVRPPSPATGTTTLIHLFVPDADALFDRAIAAGATPVMPPADMMWGDRYGQLCDPFGHVWAVATHKEDVSPAELQKRTQAFFAQMAGGGDARR